MSVFKVTIKDIMGSRNSYGYFAGEEYAVQEDTAINYRIVNHPEKNGWIVYHAHCTKVEG